MRLHAQTAMIENGFVHIPETAPWLAEYLHELTVFLKGKHAGGFRVDPPAHGTRSPARSLRIALTGIDCLSAKMPVKPSR